MIWKHCAVRFCWQSSCCKSAFVKHSLGPRCQSLAIAGFPGICLILVVTFDLQMNLKIIYYHLFFKNLFITASSALSPVRINFIKLPTAHETAKNKLHHTAQLGWSTKLVVLYCDKKPVGYMGEKKKTKAAFNFLLKRKQSH